MGEVYDPQTVKRHISPTKRLIQQKNSAHSHKEILSHEQRSNRQGYNLHYTSAPGRSYNVEPKGGSLPYDLAYKNPDKFYNYVMKQEVKTHKVVDDRVNGRNVTHVITKIGTRKIGKIMLSIQEKLCNYLIHDNDNSYQDEQQLQEAMQDTNVKEAVQKMVRQRTIELVDDKNEPILREEMKLIGKEGDGAIAKSPEMLEANKEGRKLE